PGSRAPPELIPGATTFPPVSTSSIAFRHVISGSLVLVSPDLTWRGLPRLFLRRSPPTLLTSAARSGLEPAPDRRLRGTYPHCWRNGSQRGGSTGTIRGRCGSSCVPTRPVPNCWNRSEERRVGKECRSR